MSSTPARSASRRDGGNNATGFALYDEDAATVTFHRLAYHYQGVAATIAPRL